MAFQRMEEVLEYLFKYAEDRPLVLVLDEYPHLQKLIAGCDGVIQGLIDQYEGKSKLKIILCGSHMDIMRSLVEHAAPLYGRAGLVLHLKALDYYEASAYFPTFSNEDKVRFYAAFGGSPGLLRHIDPGKTVRENIIDVFMEPDGVGTTLTDMLLSDTANARHLLQTTLPELTNHR